MGKPIKIYVWLGPLYTHGLFGIHRDSSSCPIDGQYKGESYRGRSNMSTLFIYKSILGLLYSFNIQTHFVCILTCTRSTIIYGVL